MNTRPSEHKLTADHNGEPVCACGFNPQQSLIVKSRQDAIALVSRHRANVEECATILRRLGMGTVSKEAARAALGLDAYIEHPRQAGKATERRLHAEGERLVAQIHELVNIKARLEQDRAEYTGNGEDQSIRDRARLLDIIKDQATRIGAVDQLHARESIAVHEGHGIEYWCPACATYWPCKTTKAIHGDSK